MRFFKAIFICFILIGCTPADDVSEDPEFISELIEKSMQSTSGIDLAMNLEESGSDSLKIEFIITNPSGDSVDILHSSSYPMVLIYARGEMIKPSPKILDELVIFHDLVTTRIGVQESKRIKEIRFKKPLGDSFQLRGYMVYKMEREELLYKELHTITDEIVFGR